MRFFTFIFTFIFCHSFAQTIPVPSIEWSKRYDFTSITGSPGNQQNVFRLANGNYAEYYSNSLISPHTKSFIIRDSSGAIIDSVAALTEGNRSYYSISSTNNGGYLLGGTINDETGNPAGAGYHGGYDGMLVKFDTNFQVVWERFIGGTGDEFIFDSQSTADNGVVFCGYTTSNDNDLQGIKTTTNRHYLVGKTDSLGSIEWIKTYGGLIGPTGFLRFAEARKVIQDSNGNYVVSGTMASTDGDVTGNKGHNDYWVLKLNSTGNIIWQKSLGGSGNDMQTGGLIQTQDGNYIVSGVTYSADGDVSAFNGTQDIWTVKLNANTGNIIWDFSLGGNGMDSPTDGGANNISELPTTGNIVIVGSSTSTELPGYNGGYRDVILAKINGATGTLIWQDVFGSSADDAGMSVFANLDGSITVFAGTDLNSNDGDLDSAVTTGSGMQWVFKLAPGPLNTDKWDTSKFSYYPNPANDIVYFTESVEAVQVYDITGKQLLQQKDREISEINVSALQQGTYIVTVTKEGTPHSFKIIKK